MKSTEGVCRLSDRRMDENERENKADMMEQGKKEVLKTVSGKQAPHTLESASAVVRSG